MNRFAVEQLGNVTCIGLPARVDVTNAKAFVDVVRAEIDKDKRQIVLDLSHTEAIDSTALGAIVQIFKSLRARDGELSMAGVGDGVRRVLAITRIDRVFPLFATVEEAVRFGNEKSA